MTLIIIKKNRVFQNIIESSNIFLLLLFCYCKIVVKSFVTENFIPRRLSDHNIITFAISHVIIAKLAFLLLLQDFITELKTKSIFEVLVVWGI